MGQVEPSQKGRGRERTCSHERQSESQLPASLLSPSARRRQEELPSAAHHACCVHGRPGGGAGDAVPPRPPRRHPRGGRRQRLAEIGRPERLSRSRRLATRQREAPRPRKGRSGGGWGGPSRGAPHNVTSKGQANLEGQTRGAILGARAGRAGIMMACGDRRSHDARGWRAGSPVRPRSLGVLLERGKGVKMDVN